MLEHYLVFEFSQLRREFELQEELEAVVAQHRWLQGFGAAVVDLDREDSGSPRQLSFSVEPQIFDVRYLRQSDSQERLVVA